MFKNNAIAKTLEILYSHPDFVNSPTIDIDVFQDLRASIGDDLGFSDLVTIYLSSAEALIKSIQAAFDTQDAIKFNMGVHSLKSTSASIGAIKLSQICRYLEKISKAGEIMVSSEFLDLISNEHEQVIAAIQNCILEFMTE